MIGTSLAIAIPTYCRSNVLAISLPPLLREAQKFQVTVYVSDDSPDDSTSRLVDRLSGDFTNLRYRKNPARLGHDQNVVATLTWPATEDYVWLLGDALIVAPDKLSMIVDLLGDQNFVFLNSKDKRSDSCRALIGAVAQEFLRKKLWHQTLTGATIYHRTVCTWARRPDLRITRNFPQLSVVLGYASTHDISIGWVGERVMTSGPKESYWRDEALDVFVGDWVRLVSSYPTIIRSHERPTVIRSHSENSRLFKLDFLVYLRRIGRLTSAAVRQPHFFDAMHVPRWQLMIILLTPIWVVRLARAVHRHAKNLRSPDRS